MNKIKAGLAKIKPWLKQHWHMVLVVAVALAIFLYVVLRKGTGVSAVAFPPATVDPNAGTAAAGADTTATAPATPVANPPATPATPSGSAAGARGTSGGSLFDPPVQLKSVASSQAIPTPQSFSQVIQFGPLAGVTPQGPSPAAHPKIIQAFSYGPSLINNVIQAGPLAGVTRQGPASHGATAPTVIPRPPAPRSSPSPAVHPSLVVGPQRRVVPVTKLAPPVYVPNSAGSGTASIVTQPLSARLKRNLS